jgi:hypothetical protein
MSPFLNKRDEGALIRICDRAEPDQILVAPVIRYLCLGKQFLLQVRGNLPSKDSISLCERMKFISRSDENKAFNAFRKISQAVRQPILGAFQGR